MMIPFASRPRDTRNILLLYMEGYRLAANISGAKAIQEVIGQRHGSQIFEEDLADCRLRIEDQVIVDALRRKYTGQEMDLVMTVGPQAIKFLLQYSQELWPSTPIVFSCVTAKDLPATLPPNVTGVAGSLNFAANVDLALRLQPEVRHVVYVSGATPLETSKRGAAEREFEPYAGRMEFTYLDNLSLPELLVRLAQLPSNSVVLFTTFFKDASGQAYLEAGVCPLIAGISDAPVYGTFEPRLGCGIVGGSMSRVEAIVRQGAHLALRILKGEPIAHLPVEKGAPNEFIVDWRALRKWGISENRLPVGTIVKYREPSGWECRRKNVLPALAGLLAQSGLLALFSMQMRGRNRSDPMIRRLTGRLIKASEDERRHLARELHDDIGQRLSLVSAQLGSLNQLRAADAPDVDSDFKDSLRELDTLITDVHNLSHSLHSSKPELLGLEAALKEMCHNISQRQGLQVEFESKGELEDLNSEIAFCFYRVAQEALNNVIKHSCASRAQVTLAQEGKLLRMQVQDLGVGFNTATANVGLGLATMQERLLAIAGTFSLVSKPNGGTTITAEAPLR
jgi:signal transduction histidine kinase